MSTFCTQCGSARHEADRFCGSCGTEHASESPTASIGNEAPRSKRIAEVLRSFQNIVFLANENDPFYNRAFPLMYMYDMEGEYESLDHYLEENYMKDEAQCDNCQIAFTDLLNWSLDDGNKRYGIYCPECAYKILHRREIFSEEIPPAEYINWSRLMKRPHAIAQLDYLWRMVQRVDAKPRGYDMPVPCWSCRSEEKLVDLAQPHWEMIFNPHDSDPHIEPVCDDCVGNGRGTLIPSTDLTEKLNQVA